MPPKALPVNKVPSFKPVTLAGRNSDGKAKAQGLNSSSSAGPSSQAEEAAQLQQLVAELEAHMRGQDADEVVQNHISLLHEYNEVKDITTDILNRIAYLRGATLQSVMADYDVPTND